MFSIENGRESFFQWDLDQRLIVADSSIKEVHFCNKTDECALISEVYEEEGKRLVNVPNILLQTTWKIRAYAYCDCYTKVEQSFKVNARSKPSDYVYTETEIKNYSDLEERINQIEEKGISEEALIKALEDYFIDNPIESGATEAERAQIAQNTEEIAELKQIDHSQFALKEEIPVIPDLSQYALKSEIPDTSTFTTMGAVEAKGYQTEEQVNVLINTALGVIENGSY